MPKAKLFYATEIPCQGFVKKKKKEKGDINLVHDILGKGKNFFLKVDFVIRSQFGGEEELGRQVMTQKSWYWKTFFSLRKKGLSFRSALFRFGCERMTEKLDRSCQNSRNRK